VLGETEFFGTRFAVRPGVFIPRPETETIVAAALEALSPLAQERGALRLLDLGSGSGCIALSLARRLAACTVVGVELSWTSLRTARRNAQRLGLTRRVRWIQGVWTDAVRGVFDGIVSNPPYVPTREVEALPLDVRREPRVSLDGGADGMQIARRLLDEASRLLAPGGIVVLECGEDHVAPLMRSARARSWAATVAPLRDLAGRPRGLMVARRRAGSSR
jgi:release factor glutamine methyltransferase